MLLYFYLRSVLLQIYLIFESCVAEKECCVATLVRMDNDGITNCFATSNIDYFEGLDSVEDNHVMM